MTVMKDEREKEREREREREREKMTLLSKGRFKIRH